MKVVSFYTQSVRTRAKSAQMARAMCQDADCEFAMVVDFGGGKTTILNGFLRRSKDGTGFYARHYSQHFMLGSWFGSSPDELGAASLLVPHVEALKSFIVDGAAAKLVKAAHRAAGRRAAIEALDLAAQAFPEGTALAATMLRARNQLSSETA